MPFIRRHHGAGASARRMAAAIRTTERRAKRRRALRAAPAVTLLGSGTGYAATSAGLGPAGITATAALCAAVLYSVGRIPSTASRNWAKGAAGERRTARILAPLTRFGRYAVLHDRAIPRSRANLDHIVLGPFGILYVDTKTWTSTRSALSVRHGELYYGRYSQTRALSTVQWESDQVARALGHPARTVVAVHGAAVPGGCLTIGAVTVIPASRLRSYIRSLPAHPAWDRAAVARLRRDAERQLPPAT